MMDNAHGNMIHGTLKPRQTARATRHVTVSEFWYVLEGQGEIWRKNESEEHVTPLSEGVAVDIPVGTHFQYRNVGDTDLRFICVATPKWPGEHEATFVEGHWQTSNEKASGHVSVDEF